MYGRCTAGSKSGWFSRLIKKKGGPPPVATPSVAMASSTAPGSQVSIRSSGLAENSGRNTDVSPMMWPTGVAVSVALGVTRGAGARSSPRKVAHVRWSARKLRWVWITPFGAAVVPEV